MAPGINTTPMVFLGIQQGNLYPNFRFRFRPFFFFDCVIFESHVIYLSMFLYSGIFDLSDRKKIPFRRAQKMLPSLA